MRFGSVCSGIEAASVAWKPLGWKAAWFSEIEAFPSAVLAHHYPQVPNLGDMTLLPDRIREGEVEAPDVFCGGTPCQAFSVAGKRQSLGDARGNLSLVFCEIANAIDDVRGSAGQQPTIVFWENVPGVLSTKDNAFGCFLGELAGEECPIEPPRGKWSNAGCVYGPKRAVAWRVLDAQYFGVAQRRRRVFVVASAREDIDPAAILFEFDGLRRDTAPSREAGKEAAKCLTTGVGQCYDPETESLIPAYGMDLSQKAEGIGFKEESATTICGLKHPGHGNHVLVALRHHALGERTGFGIGEAGDPAYTLTKGHSHAVAQPAYGFLPKAAASAGSIGFAKEQSPTLKAGCPSYGVMRTGMAVRRLTPVECERLQGFPDNYTAIPWRNKPAIECPDGPRYKALGNSWAVPNVRWIGERIQLAIEVAA